MGKHQINDRIILYWNQVQALKSDDFASLLGTESFCTFILVSFLVIIL